MSSDMQASREMYYYPVAESIVDGVKWYSLRVNKKEIMTWITSQDRSMWWIHEGFTAWSAVFDIHGELLTAIKLKFTV